MQPLEVRTHELALAVAFSSLEKVPLQDKGRKLGPRSQRRKTKEPTELRFYVKRYEEISRDKHSDRTFSTPS